MKPIERSPEPAVQSATEPLEKWISSGLLVLTLLVTLWAMTRELNKPLLDMHSFRQTQTAISAYYMSQDSNMFFDYITPVLGKPWAIPMEVPIYQWLVARFHCITGMGLDQSGKLISILLWFACLWPIWLLLNDFGFSRSHRCIICAIIYSSPLYLYWGRAFMMETTAVFLSLGMTCYLFGGYSRRNWRFLIIGLAFGVCAALCKVTTCAIAIGTTGLLVLFSHGRPILRDWRWIVSTGILAVLPMLPAKLWLQYGDSAKQLNPFARRMMISNSPEQARWNFGTLEQKLDWNTWGQIRNHVNDQLLISAPGIGSTFMILILVAGIIAAPKRLPIIIICLIGFASGPLIFTHLYFEHNYYWIANSIWFLFAVAIALTGIVTRFKKTTWGIVAAYFFAAVVTTLGFVKWSNTYLSMLHNLPEHEQLANAWIDPVQRVIPPERTLLIVGNGWNPNSLYYAQRKGIAFPVSGEVKFAFPGPELIETLGKLDNSERLGGVVFSDNLLTEGNSAFITAFLTSAKFSLNGTRTAFGVLFPAQDLQP